VRYEWLSLYHWEDLEHVQRFATDWMWTYNHDRPNMALGRIYAKTAAGHGRLVSTSELREKRRDYRMRLRSTTQFDTS